MFKKDFDDKIKELINKYELAQKKGMLPFFEEQDLEQIFLYYFNLFEFEKAIQVADVGISTFKYSFTFYNHKAETLKELSDYHQALEVLELAEIFSPNEMSILLNKIDVYSLLERYEEAILLLNEAIERSTGKEKAELYLELADVYEDAENYSAVISSLKSCLEIDNENEEALNRIWFSVELTESYEESIDFHQKLIDSNPYNDLAWNNLGHAYKGLKLHEKAIEAFEYVMAIDETYEPAYIDCADIYFHQKEYKKAIELYAEVLDITSFQKDIYYSIGKCYDALENYHLSRDFYREALSLDPYFANAYFKIGRTYLLTDSPKSALTSLKKAYKLDNKNFDFQTALAEAYLLLGQHDKALKIYDGIIKENESNKQIHLNLLTILYESGNINEAINHINSIEDKFDDISDLLYVKVAFLYELDKREEAIVKLYEALAYDSEKSQLLMDLLPILIEDKEFMQIIKAYSN